MAKKDNSAQDHEIEKASRLIKDTITQHFGQITDPRRINSTTYKLTDIIFVTICAVLCGNLTQIYTHILLKIKRCCLA